MIASGVLVHAFAVVGQLASDGAVELISLEVDLGTGWPVPRRRCVQLKVTV